MSEVEKRYYTEKEFCEIVGISRKTAFAWREKKLIGFIRTPTGVIRYPREAIEKFDQRNSVRAKGA